MQFSVAIVGSAQQRPNMRFPRRRRSIGLVERVQKGDEGLNLRWVEDDLWHFRVSGHDALGQGLGKIFDRVSPVEHSERGRFDQRAGAARADRMAARAARLGNGPAILNRAVLSRNRRGKQSCKRKCCAEAAGGRLVYW